MGEAALQQRLEHELDEAEMKAFDSLSRYKFQMFGYWAAIWVHLNQVGGFRRPNPFRALVLVSRADIRRLVQERASRLAAERAQ